MPELRFEMPGLRIEMDVRIVFGMTLSLKQRFFAQEYLVDFNATRAAIRAGFSPATARSQGQRMLTNVDIQKTLHSATVARLPGACFDRIRQCRRLSGDRRQGRDPGRAWQHDPGAGRRDQGCNDRRRRRWKSTPIPALRQAESPGDARQVPRHVRAGARRRHCRLNRRKAIRSAHLRSASPGTARRRWAGFREPLRRARPGPR
jgi:hypothetical protein